MAVCARLIALTFLKPALDVAEVSHPNVMANTIGDTWARQCTYPSVRTVPRPACSVSRSSAGPDITVKPPNRVHKAAVLEPHYAPPRSPRCLLSWISLPATLPRPNGLGLLLFVTTRSPRGARRRSLPKPRRAEVVPRRRLKVVRVEMGRRRRRRARLRRRRPPRK